MHQFIGCKHPESKGGKKGEKMVVPPKFVDYYKKPFLAKTFRDSNGQPYLLRAKHDPPADFIVRVARLERCGLCYMQGVRELMESNDLYTETLDRLPVDIVCNDEKNGKCRECRLRAIDLTRFVDADNRPVFMNTRLVSRTTADNTEPLEFVFEEARIFAKWAALYSELENWHAQFNKDKDYDIVLVTKDLFAESQKGKDGNGAPYFHFAILPDDMLDLPALKVSQEMAAMANLLCNKQTYDYLGRLSENFGLLEAKDRLNASLQFINRFTRDDEFADMTLAEQHAWVASVKAACHFERGENTTFRGARRLLDKRFICEPIELVIHWLDERMNPAMHRIPKDVQEMRQALSVNKQRAELTWDDPNHEYDLDLSARFFSPSGRMERVWFNNVSYDHGKGRGTTRLDLDANAMLKATECVDKPCEIISCVPGVRYDFQVWNWRSKTAHPIDYTLTIYDMDNVVETQCTWGEYCDWQEWKTVKSYTFSSPATKKQEIPRSTPISVPFDLVARQFGQDPNFGEFMRQAKVLAKEEASRVASSRVASSRSESRLAWSRVASIAEFRCDVKERQRQGGQYKNMGTSLYFQGKNACQLLFAVAIGKVFVNPRAFTAGYVTKISAIDYKLRDTFGYLHYETKNAFPVRPQPGTRHSSSRAYLTDDWFSHKEREVRVTGIVWVPAVRMYFMAMENARLPKMRQNDEQCFPLAGGFQKQQLQDQRRAHDYCLNDVQAPEESFEFPSMIGAWLFPDDMYQVSVKK